MSTATMSRARSAVLERRVAPRASLLRRIFDAIIASRIREAQHRVAVHLSALGDQRLESLGFSAAEIETIRAGEPIGRILARRAGRKS
jgi:hypothetical protein